MAKVKYDVSDVEAGGGGVEPTPGLYPGKIVQINHRTKKNDGTKASDLEVVVDIGTEYVRLWTYIQLPDSPSFENSKWKLREFTDALGLPPKGEIDPKKLEGKPVMVKTKWRRDDAERAEIKNLFAPGKETVGAGEAAALANPTGDAEDYTTWSLEELVAEIESRDLEVPAGRKTVAKLADVLTEADAAAEGDPEVLETGEAEPDGELTESDPGFYGDWSDQDLKDQLADDGVTVEGRFSRNKAIEALVAFNETGAEAAAEGAADEPDDDYDTWTDDELKEEIVDRNKTYGEDKLKVAGRWSKDKAIALLRADNQEDPF